MKTIIHKVTCYLTTDRVAEVGAWAMAFGVIYVLVRGIITMV